jgi:hypothetical protein
MEQLSLDYAALKRLGHAVQVNFYHRSTVDNTYAHQVFLCVS